MNQQIDVQTVKLGNWELASICKETLNATKTQMRCVCKSSNGLLSESSFVKSHLHHSLHNSNPILLFFHVGFSIDKNLILARPTHSPDLELTNFIKGPFNLQPKYGYVNVIGSANGLICLSYLSYSWPASDYIVYIWNPSLSAVLTLPPCSLPFRGPGKIHFRFGYDPKTDDYKVVKLTSLIEPCKMVEQGEVYSMRSGSWGLISQLFPANIRFISIPNQDDARTDGHDSHLYWIGYIDEEKKAQAIVGFDLGAETFREIPLPHSFPHHHGDRWNVLGVLGGKFCVMSNVARDDGKCEVWVMNEYGEAESWVKHHAFSQFSWCIEPYGFTSHSEFLFRDGGRYDPMASETKTFKIGGGIRKVVEYVDSLVWVAPAKGKMNSCSISQLQI